MRTFLALCGLLYALEAATYSVLPPMLPTYARDLGLSTGLGGYLVSAYILAVLPGAWVGARLACRHDARRAVLLGLLVMAGATVALGLADTIPLLFATRAVQGLAGGAAWGSALRWMLDVTPPNRHGRVLALTLGTATIGTLAGPIIGTAALVLHPLIMFSALAAVTLALAGALATRPRPTPVPTRRVPGLYALPRVRRALVLAVVPCLTLGVVLALMPTRLVALGMALTGPGVILIGAAIAAIASHALAGWLTDHHDPRPMITCALALTATATAVLAATDHWPLAAVATAIVSGPLYAAITTPSTTMLTRAVTEVGAPHIAPLLTVATVAGGEGVGSFLAGLLGELAAWLPYTLLATLSAATAIWLTLRVRRDSANRRPYRRPSE